MEAVREKLVTFEPFSDLDELTLQEVLVEMMREGSPGRLGDKRLHIRLRLA